MPAVASMLFHLAVFSFLPSITLAQNTWLYPDPKTNPTFNYIDVLNASWTTIFDSPNLILWCTANGGGAYGQRYNQSVPPIGNRLFHLSFSDTIPQVCHFDIGAQENFDKNNLNSADFTIQIESSRSTVTWSPTNPTSSATFSGTTHPTSSATSSSMANPTYSATSLSTTGSPASPTFGPAVSTSASPPNTEKSSSGLSPAAKAGIGIGTAAGSIALISGLLLWLRTRRRRRLIRLGNHTGSMPKQPGYHASETTASDTPIETNGNILRHEMSGNPIAQARLVEELEGSGVTEEPVGTAR